jgi:hypothetical protein
LVLDEDKRKTTESGIQFDQNSSNRLFFFCCRSPSDNCNVKLNFIRIILQTDFIFCNELK